MDADGQKTGYDLDLVHAMTTTVDLPVIASGGAGEVDHFTAAAKAGADAVLAASVFHFGQLSITEVKQGLAAAGLPSVPSAHTPPALTRDPRQGKLAGGGDPAPNLWWPTPAGPVERQRGHTPGSVARCPPVARALLLGSRPRDPTEDWVMPTDKDFKRLVRARMGKTGESYTTARSHLRPDGHPGRPGLFRGRHPDTAALTRLLADLGVTDPTGGQPRRGDGARRLRRHRVRLLRVRVRRPGHPLPGGPDQLLCPEAGRHRGRPDPPRGPVPGPADHRAGDGRATPGRARPGTAGDRHGGRGPPALPVPAGLAVRHDPQDVLVELRGDLQPLLWDLAPAPFPVTWTELAEARAGVRSAKHRLVVAEPRTDRSTWPARPPPGWPTPGRACWSRRCATSACPGWASGPSC